MSYKDPEKRREYQREYMRSWYQRNKARHTSYVRNRDKKMEAWLQEYKSSLCCEACGSNQAARLKFYHRDPQSKKFYISRIRNCPSIKALQAEIAKCRVLCAACYYRLHVDQTQPIMKFNRKQSEQLGMPYGTACARLRKLLLFHLLTRHNENVCFRCSLPIKTVEELSIEHKQPWLDVSADLFWEMSNIAFSHLRCNRPDRPNSERWKKRGPEGTAWCSRCKTFLPTEMFMKSKQRWNGLSNECSPCHTKRQREWQRKKSLERRKDEATAAKPATTTANQ